MHRPALRPERLDRLRRTRSGLWRRSADARSTAIVVAVAVLGGVAAAGFARACDAAMALHGHLLASNRWATLALLPLGFAAAAWATRRFAPAAAGSGIPQVIAAAETRWDRRRGGRRVSLATAAWKVVLSAAAGVRGIDRARGSDGAGGRWHHAHADARTAATRTARRHRRRRRGGGRGGLQHADRGRGLSRRGTDRRFRSTHANDRHPGRGRGGLHLLRDPGRLCVFRPAERGSARFGMARRAGHRCGRRTGGRSVRPRAGRINRPR